MEVDDTVKGYLEKLYHNPKEPAAFSGVDKLYREVKRQGVHTVSKTQIKKFLQSQVDYTVQKQNRRKFKRRCVVVSYVGYQCDSDTANFTSYVKHNKGYKYFLLVIGVMSKMAYTRPLKTLKSYEMAKSLKSIFKEFNIKFERIRTDMGSEYKGEVKLLLKVFI